MMAAQLILLISALSPLFIWISIIRPYCRNNGAGHVTGIDFHVASWIDWQFASEIAARWRNLGMIILCRVWLVIQLTIIGCCALAFAASARG